MFKPSQLTFPIETNVPYISATDECKDHTHFNGTADKWQYRLYKDCHRYLVYAYDYRYSITLILQKRCMKCLGWEPYSSAIINSKDLKYTHKEAIEIKKILFATYPNHIAKYLRKVYRKELHIRLSMKANRRVNSLLKNMLTSLRKTIEKLEYAVR